jgi:hypothetical protein
VFSSARVVVAQARDVQHRQRRQLVLLAGLADREHAGHRLGEQTACDEGEHLCGGTVQPLGVVDDAHQRALLGRRREQAQHGQADEKAVRCRPGT